MGVKIILTGATGMVGEGVLFECLQNTNVSKILILGRKTCGIKHPKIAEYLIDDFIKLRPDEAFIGFDGCFYCAGVSSVGMKEEKYSYLTYDTTLHVAETLVSVNPKMVFNYVTGSHTDTSEKGSIMWARVKGKTENALLKLPFKAAYNFRPGLMIPFKEQKNVKGFFKPVLFLYPKIFPTKTLTLKQVGKAMVNAVTKGYSKNVLEIADIKLLADDD